MKKIKIAIASFALACLAIITAPAQDFGGCSFFVSLQYPALRETNQIVWAAVVCMNEIDHDPSQFWIHGMYTREVGFCVGDKVIVIYDTCTGSGGDNHVIKIHSIPPSGPERYDYGNSPAHCSKTVFLLDRYCSNHSAYGIINVFSSRACQLMNDLFMVVPDDDDNY